MKTNARLRLLTDKMREEREALGISCAELARRAGLFHKTVARLEAREQPFVRRETAEALTRALNADSIVEVVMPEPESGGDDLKGRYFTYMRDERERAASSIKLFGHYFDVIERRLEKPLHEVTADDMRDLRDQMRREGYAPGTIKGKIVAVRSFHKWGVLEGLWPANGILMLPSPREDYVSSPPLSLERVRKILAAVEDDPLENRVVYLPSYAGVRIGEAAAIVEKGWEDGWLRFRHQKSRLPGEIPVHPDLKARRGVILSHPTPHKCSLQKAKERVERRVGFEFVAHQLRKSFASLLFDAGIEDRVVKTLLGHKQDVTSLYVTVSQRRKVEAIRALPY